MILDRVQSKKEEAITLDNLFASRGRVKILKLLADNLELNISKIVQSTCLNHSSTRSHLNLFVDAGIVEKKEFGRIQIYRFRVEDLKVRAIKRLFDLWENKSH